MLCLPACVRVCWSIARLTSQAQTNLPTLCPPADCIASKFLTIEGAAADLCEPCPSNSVSAAGATQCKCDVGYTGPDGGNCLACEAGKYKSSTGGDACATCSSYSVSLAGSDAAADCRCVAGYEGPDGGACVACDAGKFKVGAGSQPCSDCPAGSWSPTASVDGSSCQCNAGYSGPDGSICDTCPAGKYKELVGTASCQDCPAASHAVKGSATQSACVCNAGYTGSDGGEACTECPTGSHKADPGSSACMACASGKYSSSAAATSAGTCLMCPADSWSPEGSGSVSGCTCNAGYKGPAGGACTRCESGFFKEASGDAPCSSCEQGYTSPPGSTSADSCALQCGAGSYGEDNGPCTPCPAGTFGTGVGSRTLEEACTGSCPAESTSPQGSSSSSACRCNKGYTGPSGGACTACSAGKYKETTGSSECVQCEAGKYSTSEAKGATSSSSCRLCPAGSSSPAGSSTLARCTCSQGLILNETSSGVACVEQGLANSCLAPDCNPGEFLYLCTCARCEACRAGTQRQGCVGSSPGSCENCAAGTFKASFSTAECSACPEGMQSAEGASACGKSESSSCKPGYVAESGSPPCTACAAGKYRAQDDSACTACPANSDSKAGSTSRSLCLCVAGFAKGPDGTCSAQNVPIVRVSVSLPMTASDFRKEEQRFVAVLARSAAVSPSKVRVVSVTEEGGRRLLAASVTVVTEIASEDPENLMATLAEDSLNKGLEAAGLPKVEEGSMAKKMIAPTTSSSSLEGTPAPASPTSDAEQDSASGVDMAIIVGSAVGGSIFVLLLGYYLVVRRRVCVEPDPDSLKPPDRKVASLPSVEGQIVCADGAVAKAQKTATQGHQNIDTEAACIDIPV